MDSREVDPPTQRVWVGLVLLGAALGASSWAIEEKPVDPAISQSSKECLAAARNVYELAWHEFKPFDLTKGDGEDVYRWSRRWMEWERDLAATKAERVAAAEKHLDRMKALETEIRNYGAIHSTIPMKQMQAAAFYRAEAELWLAKEKSATP